MDELELDLPPVDPFVEFWAAFPRKRDRLRAEANFRRACRVASAADIIAGARKYAAVVAGWHVDAIQWPDSWLSRERWRIYVPEVPEWLRAPWAEVRPEPTGWESDDDEIGSSGGRGDG